MAFGKKKDDGSAAEPEDAPESASGEQALPDATAPVDAAPPPPPAAAEPAAAAGSDALLSMFQSTESETDDLAVLVDLAGETDMDDLLEELRTIRAAFGITDAFEDEDLAAA